MVFKLDKKYNINWYIAGTFLLTMVALILSIIAIASPCKNDDN